MDAGSSASFVQTIRRAPLLREAAIIAAVIELAVFLVYHFFVHTIANRRPLGGVNVAVSLQPEVQSQAAFALVPGKRGVIVGASNDKHVEEVRVYGSVDGGRRWSRHDGPVVPNGCARGEPRVGVSPNGTTEYLAFLAAPYCGDNITTYLVFTKRPVAGGRWAPQHRLAPRAWQYGFDDGPAMAVDPASGRVYLAWIRSLTKFHETVVLSTSADGGATWTGAKPVADAALHLPHLVSIAVAPGGDVYLAGIDAKLGVWAMRSTDRGLSFTKPVSLAPLAANPASECAQAALSPLPREERDCAGPDPTIAVTRSRVVVVYADYGANRTSNVYDVALDRALRPLGRAQVNPPDATPTMQYLPAAAADEDTGAFWACWYDSTFDPHNHRSWFTCSASRDGRTWSAPERAAAEPSYTAFVYATLAGFGLRSQVVAAGGTAHVFWADMSDPLRDSEIVTAALPEQAAFARR